jgi:hypothetical protein
MTKRIFMTRGRTRPVFVDFTWRTTRWLLIIGGSYSIQRNRSVIASSRSLVRVMYLTCLFIFFVLMERNFSIGTHQASVNKAPSLPLTIGLMGELVKNKEVGRKVAAEEFEGPALDPSAEEGNAK